MPGWLRGRLSFASVIEEECTGNGTLAAARAGVLADAAVLLEPTDLGLLLGGVGILWAEIDRARAGCARRIGAPGVNPVEAAWRVIGGAAGRWRKRWPGSSTGRSPGSTARAR